MAKKKRTAKKTVETLRHGEASRKNIPTAEHQSVMNAEEQTPIRVAYERRDRDLDPQLVWRGKDCQDWSDLVVHAPPLYIQEKVHPKVLIDDLMRRTREQERAEEEEKQPTLFADLYADFNGLPDDARSTDFYQHDANWTNRMILGDSLQVMASLAEREGLRGQVQCIYLDPPYGIKFNSNFQWSTTSRDVKDGNVDHITREPEQVKAFRDTWRDGIHSYLTYLRDRLTVARDLLHETGSIFVQIGDENVHRVRALLDEVFGESNFVSMIAFKTSVPLGASYIPGVLNYLLMYAKQRDRLKYRRLFAFKEEGEGAYTSMQLPDGTIRTMSKAERDRDIPIPEGARYLFNLSMLSAGRTESCVFQATVKGRNFNPGGGKSWKTNRDGMARLELAGRLYPTKSTVRYLLFHDDYPVSELTDIWDGTSAASDKTYVVQTNIDVAKRCLLMATDPGDLILDPTCGSGTTAYVAEQWGRRWITIDTSRVSLALARARIMGARYPFYLLADSREGQKKEADVTRTEPSSQPVQGNIRHGFVYERVPHITLKSIANNTEIDVIWEQRQPAVEKALAALNAALRGHKTPFKVTDGGRSGKALDFTAPENKTVTLPSGETAPAGALLEWEVPREAPDDWPSAATKPLEAFWKARIARQKDIDASIAARAEFEYLYDKPYEDKKKVRVAGPFTVESLTPHRVLGVDEDDELIDGVADADSGYGEEQSFVQMILENLKAAGVQQAHKEDKINFTSISPWPGELVCAAGNYIEGDEETGAQKRAAIFVGPEFGTVSRPDLVAAAREAGDAGFDALIACAFNYDAHSSEFSKLGRIPVLKARMNADLHMADDLKNTGKGNLFVIFGEPDIEVACGQWLVAKNGRKVANYEFVKELSGLGRLEEINRLGREDLPRLKQLSRDGAVRADESVTAGRGVGAVEHRRGSGADRDRGIPAKPERRSGVAGGGGDAVDSGGPSGDAAAARDGGAADRGGHHQPYAGRAEAVAAIQSLTETDFPLSLTTDHRVQVTIHGVDVFHPNTGEVRSDGAEGIACWFIDTDYNEESFFVRQAYFLGANDPYKSLKTTLKAEINEDAWETLHSDTSRPFNKPQSGRIAVKVINHLGDEVMKVFRVE